MPPLLSAWKLLRQQFRVLPPLCCPQQVLLSAASVTQSLAEHVCPSPSSLPPFLQHSSSPKCCSVCKSKRERVRMVWGPRSHVGWVASDKAFADLTLWSGSTFPWLFWEHLRDCSHCTALPCGHTEHVIHGLLMHCMRGRCFAWHYLYMSREEACRCKGMQVEVSHLSQLSRKKSVACLCHALFGKAVSCIYPHPSYDRKNSETNYSSSHFSSHGKAFEGDTIKFRELWALRLKKKKNTPKPKQQTKIVRSL